ncbi:MAG: hypothetical protein ACJA11_002988 [Glaciecola sp.]|jgi:hypothetical protein
MGDKPGLSRLKFGSIGATQYEGWFSTLWTAFEEALFGPSINVNTSAVKVTPTAKPIASNVRADADRL